MVRGIAFIAASALCFGGSPHIDTAQKIRPIKLVYENARGNQFRFEDGVLGLSAGPGWARFEDLLTDFSLEAEFRLTTPDTEAEIGIRALTLNGWWPGRGCRVILAPRGSGDVRTDEERIRSVAPPHPTVVPPGEWHSLNVRAEANRISVTIDGVTTSVVDIDQFTGVLLLQVRRGRAEFRNITVHIVPSLLDALVNAPTISSDPRLLREVKPNYTSGAMARRSQGIVEIQIVVLDDGRVGPIRVLKAPDPDFVQTSVAALREWRFAPARRDGRPVPKVVSVELEYTLRAR